MNDEEPLTAKVVDSAVYHRVRGRTTSECGASKLFHADCPCCGYRFAVDHDDAKQSLYTKREHRLKARVRNKIQAYFTDCWKWSTKPRHEHSPNVKDTTSHGVSSRSVDMVVQTGASFGLNYAYRKNRLLKKWKVWFAVLWHQAPVIGEMFFACKLGDLFAVLKAIADDSPEFAYRLRLAADTALKRDGSANGRGRDRQGAAQGAERGVEPFEDDSAVRV